MTGRAVAHLFAAVTFLYGPGFMVWIGVNYVWPSGDLTVRLVFLIFAAVFFWHGFGWSIHHLRQTLRHARRDRGDVSPDR